MTTQTVKCIKDWRQFKKDSTYKCIGQWYDADNGDYRYYVVDPSNGVRICIGEWIDDNIWEILK